MKKISKLSLVFLHIIVILPFTSCKKNYDNPNAALEDQVYTSARGLTAAAVGLQRKYAFSRAGSVYNIVTANGFTTNELVIRNTGNLPEAQLAVGGGLVDGTNTILANVWTNASKIIFDADRIIAAAPEYADPAYASGLIAYTSIFKAMALGSLAMFWEHVPDSVGTSVTFSERGSGFLRAITTLNEALDLVEANPPSPAFLINIPAGTDIVNTLHALKARYCLFAGDYPTALIEANLVDLTKSSVMSFDAIAVNPIFETATSTNNVFQPVDSTFGLPPALAPDPSDGRISFYTTINTSAIPRYRVGGFGAAVASPWPYYVPGEMTLIKAECFIRQQATSLPDAITEINKVRTKQASGDPLGIGANQTPYAGAVTVNALLTEIYRQRCIEMFMSGLKLEDQRRFERPVEERKRNLFPYPFIERDNNPNTPADPSF